MFKYDVHVHTSEVSQCGHVDARTVARLYKDAGYTGIVITDHYYEAYFQSLGNIDWSSKIDIFLHGYKQALEEGEKIGLTVIPGMEIRFTENYNDYLIYGIDQYFLKTCPKLYLLGLEGFRKEFKDAGLLVYQAHPFRDRMERANPLLLDGIEVFNGNPRHDSRNDLAYNRAKNYSLKMISGSDFHQTQDLAGGGIELSEEINTPAELIKVLREDRIQRLIGV